MSTEWPFAKITVPITIDEITAVTLKNRMDAAAERMMQDMNRSLYGDWIEPRKVMSWQRNVTRAKIYLNRIADAWLVLTGRADIDGGY